MSIRPDNFLEIIAGLYAEAELSPPTPECPITPLGELIGSYNLTCAELPRLTGRSALEYLMQRGGVAEPAVEVSEDLLAGFLYASPHFGSILVDRDDLLVRRRFSVAHELGHYLLHALPLLKASSNNEDLIQFRLVDLLPHIESDVEPDELPASKIALSDDGDYLRLLPTIEQMESEANEFAAELLMPEVVIRGLAARHATDMDSEELVWRLATDLLVSQAAMRWRLRNLKLLAAAEKTFH
jgi:hypothetical protein